MLAADDLDGEALAADLPAKARQRHPSPRKGDPDGFRKTQWLVRVDMLPLVVHRQSSERSGRQFGSNPPNRRRHPAFVGSPRACLLNHAKPAQLADAGPHA